MIINLGFVEIEIRRGGVRRAVSAALGQSKRDIIAAVRTHRRLTGSSLKEAVDYVNTLLPAGDKIGQRQ